MANPWPGNPPGYNEYYGDVLILHHSEWDCIVSAISVLNIVNFFATGGNRFVARNNALGEYVVVLNNITSYEVVCNNFVGQFVGSGSKPNNLGGIYVTGSLSYGGVIQGNNFSLLGFPGKFDSTANNNIYRDNNAALQCGMSSNAFIDNGQNYVKWQNLGGTTPIGEASPHTHVWANSAGQPLLQVAAPSNVTDFLAITPSPALGIQIATQAVQLTLEAGGNGVLVNEQILKILTLFQILSQTKFANLPSPTSYPQTLTWCSNARRPGQSVGAGTGMLVQSDGHSWADMAGNPILT